jgi:hypothetical protein
MGKTEQKAMELRFRKAAIGFGIGQTITAVRCPSKAIVRVSATRIFRPMLTLQPVSVRLPDRRSRVVFRAQRARLHENETK